MKDFGFVYKWTNKETGHYYIGSHCGTVDDGYVTSGSLLREAMEVYGIEAFERTILYSGPSYRQEETRQIALHDAINDTLSYNIYHSERDDYHVRPSGRRYDWKPPTEQTKDRGKFAYKNRMKKSIAKFVGSL